MAMNSNCGCKKPNCTTCNCKTVCPVPVACPTTPKPPVPTVTIDSLIELIDSKCDKTVCETLSKVTKTELVNGVLTVTYSDGTVKTFNVGKGHEHYDNVDATTSEATTEDGDTTTVYNKLNIGDTIVMPDGCVYQNNIADNRNRPTPSTVKSGDWTSFCDIKKLMDCVFPTEIVCSTDSDNCEDVRPLPTLCERVSDLEEIEIPVVCPNTAKILEFDNCAVMDAYDGTEECPLVDDMYAMVVGDDGCLDIYHGQWKTAPDGTPPDDCGVVVNVGGGRIKYYEWMNVLCDKCEDSDKTICERIKCIEDNCCTTEADFPQKSQVLGLQVTGSKVISPDDNPPFNIKKMDGRVCKYYETVRSSDYVLEASKYRKIKEAGNVLQLNFSNTVSIASNFREVSGVTSQEFFEIFVNDVRVNSTKIESDFPFTSSEDLSAYTASTHNDITKFTTTGEDIVIYVRHAVYYCAPEGTDVSSVRWAIDATVSVFDIEEIKQYDGEEIC